MVSWKTKFNRKIEPGRILTIRHDLQAKLYNSITGAQDVAVGPMVRRRGSQVEVSKIIGEKIRLCDDDAGWNYIDCMFEEYKHLDRTYDNLEK